jgi:hypothetical protein
MACPRLLVLSFHAVSKREGMKMAIDQSTTERFTVATTPAAREFYLAD